MIPSLQQTYEAAVQGVSNASRDPAFGHRMLTDSKKAGIHREVWLCEWIAEALGKAGFKARTERERIDIAIVNAKDGRSECVIEAKFLYCHDVYQDGSGRRHRFFVNVWKDIEKRRHLGLPQQEIVLTADYQSMRPNGKASGLYHAEAVSSHLSKHRGRSGALDCCGFIRFEKELFEEFEPKCDIYPGCGNYPPNNIWQAAYLGASELIRAWVLGVRPQSSN